MRSAALALIGAIALASPAAAWVRTTTCDAACDDTCASARDGACDDTTTCTFGTDCTDCGRRPAALACDDTCGSAADGSCDSLCVFGTDCTDCGPQFDTRVPCGGAATSAPFMLNGVQIAVRTPLPIYWTTAAVPYWVHADGYSRKDFDRVLAAIEQSFATWSDVDCAYLAFAYQGTTTESEAGFDCDAPHVNFVRFVEAGWGAAPYRYPSLALALTSVTYDPNDGHVVDADIEVNATNFLFEFIESPTRGTTQDLQNTLTHEVGHFAGLDHTIATAHVGDGTYVDATMAASSPGGETSKRSLHADDIAGLCDAYPLGGEPGADALTGADISCGVDEVGGRTRSKRGCAAGGADAGWWAVATLAIGLAARRRRR